MPATSRPISGLPVTDAQRLVEASPLESLKYEITSLAMSRMKRLLVVCDMHGDDLREAAADPHDGRAVMREAISVDLGKLAFYIQERLGQVSATLGVCVYAGGLAAVRIDLGKLVRGYSRTLVRACDMHPADLRDILGPAFRLGEHAPVTERTLKTLDLNDGRGVMREVLMTGFNRLNRDVSKKLDQAWH